MADSEINTTLPFVTRRRLLTSTMVTMATLPASDSPTAWELLPRSAGSDPALSLWQQWKTAYFHATGLCRKQQHLESVLADTIGFPRAEVYLPDEDMTVTVSRWEEIEELLGSDPSVAAQRANADSALATHQSRWDAADAMIGYSAAKRAELAAADRAQDMFEALISTPSTTLAGVAGKLDAVLLEGETSDECTEFPWPQIRSAFTDLQRIGRALQPGEFMPGADRNKQNSEADRDAAKPSAMTNTGSDPTT